MGGRPGEFDLIARCFAPLASREPGALGLLDDAALLTVPPGQQLVVTTDAVVAGIHFLPDDPPELVARKLLRVNLSDLAAMGARAVAYTLVTAWPPGADLPWIEAFARGLAEDQDEFGIALVGGDTVSTPGPATFAVTAFGLVDTGKALLRSGAKPGDGIFVTGTIGDAALGLRVLRGEIGGLSPEHAAALIDRYRLPRPRLSVGTSLLGLVRAGMDVSDGLLADLGHICETSGVGAVVEASEVPLSDAAQAAIGDDAERLAVVLTGGDDYELLLTAPPSAAGYLADVASQSGVPIRRIGRIEEGAPEVTVLDNSGAPLVFPIQGFRHF